MSIEKQINEIYPDVIFSITDFQHPKLKNEYLIGLYRENGSNYKEIVVPSNIYEYKDKSTWIKYNDNDIITLIYEKKLEGN